MAAGAWKIYAKAKQFLGNGTIVLGVGGDNFKMALLRQSATVLNIDVLSTLSQWSQIEAVEISQRGGYITGGRNLVPATGLWTAGVSTKQIKFTYSTTGLVYTANGSDLKDIRFAVIRNSTGASAGKLLCFCTLSTLQFTISSPNTLTILPAATGVFTLA